MKTDEIYGKNEIVNANDYRTHQISIDSRFRVNQEEPASDFSYRFTHPMKNIIQIRPTQIELPREPYRFSKAKKNTMFRLDVTDYVGTRHYLTVSIEEGDYERVEDVMKEIQRQLNEIRDRYGIFMRVGQDPVSGRVRLRLDGSGPPPSPPGPTNGPSPFGVTWVMVGRESRVYDFGLGSILGFRNHFYVVESDPYVLEGESRYEAPIDRYYLLSVDENASVIHKTSETEISALARISNPHSECRPMSIEGSVTFPRPQDLSRVRIRLQDAYGEMVPIGNWSMSLELTEVMNVELSDNYRQYLWSKKEPRVERNGNGSGAILAGRNVK